MDIPYPRWYPAIAQRRSRRRFTASPLPPEALTALRQICLGFRPFPEARAELVKAYQNIQYLEHENTRLEQKATKYKSERDEYKKKLKKSEHD